MASKTAYAVEKGVAFPEPGMFRRLGQTPIRISLRNFPFDEYDARGRFTRRELGCKIG